MVPMSWPDEERATGTLSDIVGKMSATDIERTALILIGRMERRVLFGRRFRGSDAVFEGRRRLTGLSAFAP